MSWREIEIIGGVELRDGDHFPTLRNSVRSRLGLALSRAEGDDEMALARAVETAIKDRWPDRAYFLEVGNDREGWIQVFQPFGLPRNRP